MELNPNLVVFAGLVVFVLGLLVKRTKWSPEGRPMLWLIVGISALFGIAQIALGWQAGPFPVWPGPAPAGVLLVAFVWLPAVVTWVGKVVAWVVAPCLATFAAAEAWYAFIRKGLLPQKA